MSDLKYRPVKYKTEGVEFYIEEMEQRDGSFKWAIRKSLNWSLSKEFDIEYEPFNSAKDEEFFKRCRFDSFEEAALLLEAYLKKLEG